MYIIKFKISVNGQTMRRCTQAKLTPEKNKRNSFQKSLALDELCKKFNILENHHLLGDEWDVSL